MAWVNTSPLVKTHTLEEFWQTAEILRCHLAIYFLSRSPVTLLLAKRGFETGVQTNRNLLASR